MLNPVNETARFTDASPRRTRRVREGRRPRADRALRPREARCAWPTTRTATPTAGAATLRSSTGPSPRGSPARRPSRRPAPRERDDQLASGAHQARPLRRLAREQRRLGAVARPLLGNTDPRVALRRLRARHVRRLGRPALRALRPRPHRPRPPPPVRRRRDDPVPGVQGPRLPHRPGARRVVRLRLDADRAVPLPLREPGRVPTSASPPTSSARRSTRPAAGSTRCSRSTRWCSTRPRTGTSCAWRTSSTTTA